MAKAAIDFDALSTDERLNLLEDLWASPSRNPAALPLTDAQRAELDRRLDDVEQDGPTGIPWEEVLARIQNGGT
jgi:putative addiction module component (TIGR02574 family)